jgi:hypothetical protein
MWKKEIKRAWVGLWTTKWELQDVSTALLIELATEDPLAYKNHSIMSTEKYEELLAMVDLKTRERDTVMRMEIPTRTKLTIALLYLPNGNSFRSLEYSFWIPPSTMLCFKLEVLSAVLDVLKSSIKIPFKTSLLVKLYFRILSNLSKSDFPFF